MMQLVLSDKSHFASGEIAYLPKIDYLGHVDSVGSSPYGSPSPRDRYVAATPTTTGERIPDLSTSRLPVVDTVAVSLRKASPAVEYLQILLRQPATSTSRRFQELSNEWKQATAFSSDVFSIAIHPAYQKIIGMGRQAIPYIIDELEREPHHWFWALSVLADTDPVPPADRGDIAAMSRAWIDWGRAEGVV